MDEIEKEPDEYTRLLKYIDYEAERARHGGDEGDEEEEEKEMRRLWYAPWKKVPVDAEGTKKVPQSWLETDMLKGLSEPEISNRRNRFGYNELESPRENPILKFISYFRGPILYVMELAVILAAGLRDWIDFGVIIGILALNAFVGWYQEKQAGDIVEQLKAGIAMKATVVRDGKEQVIEAREIVPGDIVVVEEGQTIPADGKILAAYDDKDRSKAKSILEKRDASKNGNNHSSRSSSPGREKKEQANGGPDSGDRKEGGQDDKGREDDDDGKEDKGPSVFSCDQSAITGESLAVDKYIGDTIYYTTGAKRGKVYMVVAETARQSFVGRTASLVTGSNTQGHFQKVMNSIGTTLLVLVVLWLLAIWIGGFFRHVLIATPSENNLLVYTLVMLIIGVPVGLPCVTTTTLAVGAAFLARRKAIVQKLTAIESLAGVDILCTDKTGTLTANQLSVHEPWAVEGVDLNWMLAVAVLASSHNIKSLDPIDKVTVVTLKDYPKAREILKEGWITHKFTPFDPVSKRITAQVEKDGKQYNVAKGAPNAILRLANPPRELQEAYRQRTQDYAKRGFRTLGVACQEQGGEWKILGLLPMFDPPRSDTAQTIAEAGELGVRVKMLTGDAVAIAIETCKQLALGTNVYDSQRLMTGGMSGSDVHDFVESADGFAEVAPEHKYQVVEMLQNRGHLTAMTGDGVNDAPSLKKADCGIAVEGASDAARSAADVVFLDEGLSTIITSIKVARQIFHRMKAYIVYRIALCLHLEIYLTLSMIILNETIRADLIVFIALFADLGTIAIAYDNAPHARAPVEWQLPKIWIISTILGLLLAGATWILRGTLFLSSGGIIQNWGSVQEILFLEVALTENWLIFVTRGAGTWPSWQLVGAILGIDIIASIFAIFGWISGSQPHNGHTDIVTVVRVWAFSFGVTVVLALVYFILNNIPWLDNIGRKKRGVKDKTREDFISNLRMVTLVHQRGGNGSEDIFRFEPQAEVAKGEEKKEQR
ncbi:plasma-membrane proton-e [Gloeophyllum trabeum ATCC 11539]|uniref:Plasma membrane ATPase n=1 Tax=Gloeophyllum trabeum (strain ATCC 11539 / FP-39264 / Madison 617) TaxID=670483 RepID=S7RFU0_GLOTA|nr:plasma-membrane proton-e [Gloeophyllum trabeum ATCC 11539]EPQ51384.1 plasma-membrane proton-e [Gloeophyllum trabeum ATCC 11539]